MRAWLVPLLLAAGAALLGHRLEAERKGRGLSQVSALEASRPGQAVGIALLGGFRGLYVDLLWYRAEGRFMDPSHPLHEIPLLYEMIGRLQPHYPSMWYYTAHRMAFDAPNKISYPTAETSWTWAWRGLEHLREGIAQNEGHPDCTKLRFYLADLYHRRCTPNRDLRWGGHALARLQETRGEDAYEEAVSLVHGIRADPEALPAWLAKAAHVRTAAAVNAGTPEEEDRNLSLALEEWTWICGLYESPEPRNRYVRETPDLYRQWVPVFRANQMAVLKEQRRALGLERSGHGAEAGMIWRRIMREGLLNTLRSEPLSEKHLRRAGALAGVWEELAGDLERLPPAPEGDEQERRAALLRSLRENAARERARSQGEDRA